MRKQILQTVKLRLFNDNNKRYWSFTESIDTACDFFNLHS